MQPDLGLGSTGIGGRESLARVDTCLYCVETFCVYRKPKGTNERLKSAELTPTPGGYGRGVLRTTYATHVYDPDS